MKQVLHAIAAAVAVTGIASLSATAADSVYDFKVKDIDGKEVDLSAYKGKVLLIVNVASKCGATPQYKNLQALHQQFADKGLVVLGFPANNYGGQEPGTEADIKQFCSTKYDVSFPMFAKVSVKGEDQAPLFGYLTTAENPDAKGDIKWNFEKFLVGKDGKLLNRFKTGTKPDDASVVAAIEKALAAN